MNEVIEDVLENLLDIKMHIIQHVNDISHLLKKIESHYQSPPSEKVNENIMKGQASIPHFRNKLEAMLQRSILKSHTKDLGTYLSQSRHDLRDSINAMQGYVEIVIEDISEEATSTDLINLAKIKFMIHQIIELIDKLRLYKDNQSMFTMLYNQKPVDAPLMHIAKHELEKYKNNFKILVADDVEANCDILSTNLKNMGYKQISVANNGLEALNLIRKNHYDLALFDIDMPLMNGIELLKNIRTQILQRKIMVVMITGADASQNAIESIRNGAEDIILKPFNADLLRVRINSCFEKSAFTKLQVQYRREIQHERRHYKNLLKAVFPHEIIDELIRYKEVKPRIYENVAVLFTDMVGFSQYCRTHSLDDINTNICRISEICELEAERYNMQKIKTVGDGFLAIAGMLNDSENPVLDCIRCAQSIKQQCALLSSKWQIHAAIDFGNVIGGIVGHRQFLFDIWGDTVNTAAHLQSIAPPGSLFLSETAWQQVDKLCDTEPLGKHKIKDLNPIEVYNFLKLKY